MGYLSATRTEKTSFVTDLTLENRSGLPDALRVLLEDYPRTGWTNDPGFNGLIQFWLERHVMFRRLMDELRAGTEAALDRKIDNRQYGMLVSRYGGMFVNQLHEHHGIEDAYYFPKLSQKDSRVEKGFAILDADHHALDRHLADFVDGANGVLQRLDDAETLRKNAGAFRDQLAGLERLLDRHLTDEEDLIVPVILRYGSADLG